MVPDNTLLRYFAMLKMFSQHYFEQFTGRAYPSTIDDIEALLTPHEKQTLYRLARKLPKDAVIVEIGSYKGGSTACFGAGSDDSVQIHCIDTFMAENVTGEKGADTYSVFQRNTQEFVNRIHIHRGFSYDIVEDTPKHIDLLFVDGDHSYKGITTDLYHYVPRMRENGILVLHDSAHPPIRKTIKSFLLPIESKRMASLPNLYAGRIQVSRFDPSAIEKTWE